MKNSSVLKKCSGPYKCCACAPASGICNYVTLTEYPTMCKRYSSERKSIPIGIGEELSQASISYMAILVCGIIVVGLRNYEQYITRFKT
jgi:hypothetical protein